MEKLKGIPKSETIWVRLDVNGVIKYAITSDPARTKYKLYTVDGDVATYTKHSATSPLDLEKYIT